MTVDRKAPAGILCALITPFREDQAADHGRLGEVIDFLVDRGVDGLFALGTTGEGPLLDTAERRDIAGAVLDRVAGRVPVVVHCGAPDTKTTADLARHAEQSGASAAAAVVPYYFGYGEGELIAHFSAVARAASGLGHYVYENPERTGYSAGVRVVSRLVNEVDNILGVKDTGDSIGKITQYLTQPGRPIDVYVGNNSTIFPALMVGARGAVSAMANAVPELVVAVYERWTEGRLDEARECQYALARITAALSGVPFIGGVKYLMQRRGLAPGGTRAPQRMLTPDQAELVDGRLAAWPDALPWLEPDRAASLG